MAARVQINAFHHVAPDGTLPGGEAEVPVDGRIIVSPPDGGCGASECRCFRGHFFQRLFARDAEGTVFGYSVEFDSDDELRALDEGQIARLAQSQMH